MAYDFLTSAGKGAYWGQLGGMMGAVIDFNSAPRLQVEEDDQAAIDDALEGMGARQQEWRDAGSNKTDDDNSSAQIFQLSNWVTSRRFAGAPKKREYLVEGGFPMGQASLFGGGGGTGKSFTALSLVASVAHGRAAALPPPLYCGGILKGSGPAVYLSGEDDEIEVHNRLDALGGQSDNLIVVPLPSLGGAPTFFKQDPATREPVATDAWADICRQLREIDNLQVVVIDPLQVFCTLDLNVPENAQCVCSNLNRLAAETGAAVIILHHFNKTAVDNPETARMSIRGSAGLVDGVRCVFAIWCVPEKGEKGARAICKRLGVEWAPDRVVQGCVVKANGLANRKIATFVRDANGVLRDVSERVRGVVQEDLGGLFCEFVARAAREGKPYTKTGDNGLFKRKAEFGEAFETVSKGGFERLVGEMLSAGRLVQAMAPGSRAVKWLDLPDGPFATGEGEFVAGAMKESK